MEEKLFFDYPPDGPNGELGNGPVTLNANGTAFCKELESLLLAYFKTWVAKGFSERDAIEEMEELTMRSGSFAVHKLFQIQKKQANKQKKQQ